MSAILNSAKEKSEHFWNQNSTISGLVSLVDESGNPIPLSQDNCSLSMSRDGGLKIDFIYNTHLVANQIESININRNGDMIIRRFIDNTPARGGDGSAVYSTFVPGAMSASAVDKIALKLTRTK